MRAIIASAMPDNPLNLVCLLVFGALFVGLLIFTFMPSRKQTLDELSRLPLND